MYNPQSSIYYWVDPSLSMGYIENGKSLETASYELLDSTFSEKGITTNKWVYNHKEKKFIYVADRHTIKSYNFLRPGNLSISDVLAEYKRMLTKQSFSTLVAISDFQNGFPIVLDSLLKNEKINFVGVDISPEKYENSSLRIVDKNIQSRTSLNIIVKTIGKLRESRSVVVSIDGTRIARKLLPNVNTDSFLVEIPLPENFKGKAGFVEFESPDNLMFDDRDYFAFDHKDTYGILILGHQDNNFPLQAALKSIPNSPWSPVIVKDESSISKLDIDSVDVILMNQISDESSMNDYLLSKINSKPILFALNDNEKGRSFYSKVIKNVGYTMESISLVNLKQNEIPQNSDTISDLWKNFPSLLNADVSIFTYWKNIPGTPILTLQNGDPLATILGSSFSPKAILFATPLGLTLANNMYSSGFFVPCLDRCLFSLTRNTNFSPGEKIAGIHFKNPLYGSGKKGVLFNTNNELISQISQQPYLSLDAGVYRLKIENEKETLLPIRYDLTESKLHKVDEQNPKNFELISKADFQKFSKRGNFSWQLLGWIVVCILLIIDFLLSAKPLASKCR